MGYSILWKFIMVEEIWMNYFLISTKPSSFDNYFTRFVTDSSEIEFEFSVRATTTYIYSIKLSHEILD